MPTTEESLEALVSLVRLHLGREVSVSLNGGKSIYSVHGRAVTVGASGEGMGSLFSWQLQEFPGAAPAAGNILRVTTRGAPESIVLPSTLLDTTTGPVTIKDESGQADVHPITVTSEGAETFDGEPSLIIDQPYAAVGIYPADGSWHICWWYGG